MSDKEKSKEEKKEQKNRFDIPQETNEFPSDITDINAQDLDGNTKIMRAIMSGDVLRFYYLLQFNPDVNIQNTKGETALMLAVSSSKDLSFVVWKLLNACRELDLHKWQKEDKSALKIACINNKPKMVKLLLSKLKSVSNLLAVLSEAVDRKNVEIARLLLQSRMAKLTLKALSFKNSFFSAYDGEVISNDAGIMLSMRLINVAIGNNDLPMVKLLLYFTRLHFSYDMDSDWFRNILKKMRT